MARMAVSDTNNLWIWDQFTDTIQVIAIQVTKNDIVRVAGGISSLKRIAREKQQLPDSRFRELW